MGDSVSSISYGTLIEVLRSRAAAQPEHRAYIHLKDDGINDAVVTYSALDREAQNLAALLQSITRPGERALLLYPAGLNFIVAFFGCLYAGVIAVPLPIPRTTRTQDTAWARFQGIIRDAQPAVALTVSSSLPRLEELAAATDDLPALRWLATDNLSRTDPAPWKQPEIDTDAVAYLQYTSGSTSLPKGVMLSHSNALHNLAQIDRTLQAPNDSAALTWLPHYHDMGLVCLLHSLFHGSPHFVMSPAFFLQQPIRWLNAISRLRITRSGGPNFAFDLCVRKTTPEQRAGLDLSRWRNAYTGAEPIRHETLERFARTFEPYGFRFDAFLPCYGLAEATLKVTARFRDKPLAVCTVDADALGKDQVREATGQEANTVTLVSSGWTNLDARVVTVKRGTSTPCAPGEVGEIWASGSNVARGYWNRPEESPAFQCRLDDGSEESFLRTGDLGFVKDEELFVTGRVRDLIIVRGHNHYPSDVEITVAKSHPSLSADGCAAFSIELDGEEQLVIAQEVERTALRKVDAQEVLQLIRANVTRQHGLETHAAILLKPGALPRTSSGKIQRFICRSKFLAGEFDALAGWERASAEPTMPAGVPGDTDGGDEAGIRTWLVERLAARLQIDPREIEVNEPFDSYGLDSAAAINLSGQLENYLGRKLPSTLLYDYPTIAAVSRALAMGQTGPHAPARAESSSTISRISENDPIAVIGMGLRFPGDACDPESFWRLLSNGVDAIDEVPRERWDLSHYFDSRPETKGKMYTRWGGFLKDIDQFDASFFGISAREADSLDPQQRLLLEVNWDALANAGIAPDDLARSRTAVFIGASTFDYTTAELFSGDPNVINSYSCSGTSPSTLAGRISYLLDLRGPSMTIDTACSSSLVAIHLAGRSLLAGESDLALAGGVNLIVSPEIGIGFCQAKMLSADGRCKTFDSAADGFVRSEGCGVVVLKRLRDALRDGDQILALIRGSAINHDGRSNGLTVPNGPAQAELITDALSRAGISPDEVDYVEAHGTGTALGDPIEVRALASVFGQRAPEQPLLLGSVKTNLGHLEAAAGVAGFIKVVLGLGHQQVPPHLHLRELTPHVPWVEWPMQVPTEITEWPARNSGRRIAGISSFGISGTNAHVVLESFTAQPRAEAQPNGTYLLPLSAKSDAALRQLAGRFAQHLQDHPEEDLAAICYTSSVGRVHYRHRLALVGSSHEELSAQLRLFADGAPAPSVFSDAPDELRSLAELYFSGERPDWSQLYSEPRPLKVSLPTYPFQRQRYWAKPTSKRVLETTHPLLGSQLRSPKIEDVVYEASIGTAQTAYLADHRVNGEAIMPAAAHLEMSLASAFSLPGGPYAIKDVEFKETLILPANSVQLVLASTAEAKAFEIYSLDQHSERWTLHSSGHLIPLQTQPRSLSLGALRQRLTEEISTAVYYQQLSAHGLDYGPSFQTIKQIHCNAEEALGEIVLPDSLASDSYHLHPALLDGAFQLVGAILTKADKRETYLPVGVEQFRYYANSAASLWAYVKLRDTARQNGSAMLVADICLLSASGETLAEVDGLRLLRTKPAKKSVNDATSESLYQVQWQRLPLPEQRHLSLDRLPTPAQLEPNLETLTTRLYGEHNLVARADLFPLLERLSRDYVLQALDQLGWRWHSGQQLSTPEVAKDLGVIESHHRLLGRLLETLAEDGFLQRATNDDRWLVKIVPSPGNSRDDWEVLVTKSPDAALEFALLRECGERLSDVLSGKIDALQLLFPNGSMSRLTEIYEASPVARVMNELMAQTIQTWLAELPPNQPVRILEVGAGTGATSSYLLKTLANARYTFTDISPLFTTAAARRFSNFDFLEYRLLDIERDPRAQGFDDQSYDIVVAANVVHATADVRQSLRHIRQLLAPAGLMLLLEPTRGDLVLDLIFGLTEGWWRFADHDLRPRYPLLDASGWIRLAATEGFSDSVVVPDDQTLTSNEALIISRAAESIPAHKSSAQSAQWLIIADNGGVGERLAQALRRKGDECVLGRQELTAESRWRGVIHLLNLDSAAGTESERLSPDELQAEIDRGCRSVLQLMQTIVGTAGSPRPPLWIVTRNAQAIDTDGISVAQSVVHGLRSVLALEHPDVVCTTVDLDAEDELEALLAEINSPSRETQVAYRNGDRYVARLVHASTQSATQPVDPTSSQPFELAIWSRGVLDHLFLQPLQRRKPGPGEIEIETIAAGMNFRDVLNAMGIYEGAGALGSECVGRIVALGEGVSDFVLGDDVIAFAAGSFSSFVTTSAAFAFRKPERLSYQEAATIPTPFLTAFHGLCNLARISAGDRVLIHNAAGGVGQAALQIALQAGAEIYATASPGKWEFLRSLGVKHIANSRSLDFAEQVLEWTNGEGVDIVLNSLPGEFIARSLAVLKPAGRFVEIGKKDIWTIEQVAEIKPNAGYSIFDLAELALSDPALIRSTFQTILAQFEQEKFRPLNFTAFPAADAVEAFRFMASAKHIGRVVLLLKDESSGAKESSLRSDASYLITGGLGGLGLLTARWLVERGARELILIGRNEPTVAARKALTELEALGAKVFTLRADVSQQHDVESMWRTIEKECLPVRGVIHAAGTLDDALLTNSRWEQFRTVMDPKVQGAWRLHCLTRDLPLDFFVMFSSVASMLGSPGQGNHACANAFLDALAHHRRCLCLPGLSINWGPWSEIGAAAKRYDQRNGPAVMRTISPAEGLALLERAWDLDSAQVGAFKVNWEDLRRRPGMQDVPFLSEVVSHQESVSQPASEFLQAIAAAPEDERYDLLRKHVCQLVAETLDWRDPQPPDPQSGLFDLGMDSLTSLELSNRLQASMGRELPTTALFDAPNIEALTRYLAAEVLGIKNEVESNGSVAQAASPAGAADLLDQIQHLSDDEVNKLLAGKGISG